MSVVVKYIKKIAISKTSVYVNPYNPHVTKCESIED